MKRLLLLVSIICLAIFVLSAFKNKINQDLAKPVVKESIAPITPSNLLTPSLAINKKTTTSLFVPYWTLPNEIINTANIDQLIYFGIKPDNNGISMTQEEEAQLSQFNNSVPAGTKKLLTLRMINTEQNYDILKNLSLQQKIIGRTIQIALENNMEGIVLDLEISAIPFDSLTQSINKFSNLFYRQTQKNKLTYSLALFGDTFYRTRPYDVKNLAQNSDMIMIMSYDLHKAKSNPGPNFPLGGIEDFGYDLKSMTDDFLQFAPPEKITVIFGLYGYDWLVDEKQTAVGQAKALTYNQIKQKFLDKCEYKNCEISRDQESSETRISYTDSDNKEHLIWFEDVESIKQKQNYLQQKGINSFSLWAYSYF
jgi:spore germination protein YaaH